MKNEHDSTIEKEFSFTDQDFRKIVILIYEVAGISLAASKREMVYSRIARRLRATGESSFADYLEKLERNKTSNEWQNFINALTTNLTSFFREEHHFPILAEYVRKHSGPLSIWCCAASTGEEPYSIAMTVCDARGSLQPNVKIVATDIDTNVLSTAQAGIYQDNRIEKLTIEQRKKFFLKGKGPQEGFVKVKPQLTKLITFEPLNLLDPRWSIQGPFDIIFCRNVMIYFDKPTQSTILTKFESMLSQQGLLFAGHSENFTYVSNAFKLEGKTVYSKHKQKDIP